jgi:hypothetical protein
MIRICAITNVYNESFNLPIWRRHYGAQIGEQNCIVVDNGTDDGSTLQLGLCGRVNMPRTPFSDHQRAKFISELATSLLSTYDVVLYTDCDELLVADPAKFANLIEFCETLKTPCATATGLNVVHHLDHEGAIDGTRGILQQRAFVQFVSPMCKSLIVREAVSWGHGFHSCSLPPALGDLFLFHLRWVDLGECLRRLTITQKIQFAQRAHHHHGSFKQYIKYFEDFSRRAVEDQPSMEMYQQQLLNMSKVDAGGRYLFEGDLRSDAAIRIPARFRDIF